MKYKDNSVEVAMCLFVTTIAIVLTLLELDTGWRMFNWFVGFLFFVMGVRYTWLEYYYKKMWKETYDRRIERMLNDER